MSRGSGVLFREVSAVVEQTPSLVKGEREKEREREMRFQ